MKKHFMCTHSFLSEEAKKKFDDAMRSMTDTQVIEATKNDKAEMLGHWRGNGDFFFCHWFAENEDAIFDTLDKLGFGQLMSTLPNEIYLYLDSGALTGKTTEELTQSN